ncbi:MAG: STAS domain-containing protein [Acidobacteriota bacterium]
MELQRWEEAGLTVLEVRGNVKVGESSQQFASELQDILDTTQTGVLIDVSNIDYVDSTGIGELVGYLLKFSQAKRRLALFRPQDRLVSLLKLTRLESHFPIFEDREHALIFVSQG